MQYYQPNWKHKKNPKRVFAVLVLHYPQFTARASFASIVRVNMAASAPTPDTDPNIPEYEFGNANTKKFHIESFRKEWLSKLKPCDYSYRVEDEDAFHANFAQEMAVSVDMMRELKEACRYLLSHRMHQKWCQENDSPSQACLRSRLKPFTSSVVRKRTGPTSHAMLSRSRNNFHHTWGSSNFS